MTEAEELVSLRSWRDRVVQFLKDQKLSPAEWLKRRDALVREAPRA